MQKNFKQKEKSGVGQQIQRHKNSKNSKNFSQVSKQLSKQVRERRSRRDEFQRQQVRGARKRVKGRQKRGHRIRYFGRGRPQGILRVPGKWVYGRLTNELVFRDYAMKKKVGERTEKQEVWYEEHRRGREEWLRGKYRKPSVRVRGEPNEHARIEAIKCGIPTVGIGGEETYVRDGERIRRLRRIRDVEEYV